MHTIGEQISMNDHFNVVDLILIDHSSLKECISVLAKQDVDQKTKIATFKKFQRALQRGFVAKEKTVYDSLVDMDEMHFSILEAGVRQEIIRKKLDELSQKISKSLDEQTEVELKVLADLVNYHLETEKKSLLPKVEQNIDQSILNEIGFQFMIMRRFSADDLKQYPDLQNEIYQMSSNNLIISRKFIKKVNLYISGLISESRYI